VRFFLLLAQALRQAELIEHIDLKFSLPHAWASKRKNRTQKGIGRSRRKLASRSVKGRVKYLLDDEKMLSRYREAWLSDRAAEELDYPIFFAVSEKGGKDNSGERFTRKMETAIDAG